MAEDKSYSIGRCVAGKREQLVQVVVDQHIGCLYELFGAIESIGFFLTPSPLLILFQETMKRFKNVCSTTQEPVVKIQQSEE